MTEERRLLGAGLRLLDYICFLKQAGPEPRMPVPGWVLPGEAMNADGQPSREFINSSCGSLFKMVIGRY